MRNLPASQSEDETKLNRLKNEKAIDMFVIA